MLFNFLPVPFLYFFHNTIVHLEVFNALSYSEVFLFPLYAFTKTFLALVHNYFPFRPMWCVFSDKQYNRRQNKIIKEIFRVY